MDNASYAKLIKDAFAGNAVSHKDAKVFKAKRTILSAFDSLEKIYLLLEGSVYVIINANNGSMIVADTLEAPQLFGLSELLKDDEIYTASLTAKSDCKIVSIPCKTFLMLLEEYPDLYPLIARYLAKLAAHNMFFMQDRSLFNNHDRLGLFLYNTASLSSLPCTIKETREQLSLLLHLNNRTLYRYIDEFKRKGYLSIDDHKITIHKNHYQKLKKDFGSLK